MAASAEAISSVLITERNGVQMPIYFVKSSGRLAKWAVELGKYEINFSPRHAVKGKILADFLLETTEKGDYLQDVKSSNCMWKLHTDGASSEEGVGAGLVLTSPEREEHTYALITKQNMRHCFLASAYAQQVNGEFEAKDISMKRYLQLVDKISKNFETLKVVQISRKKNKKADVLSKLATLTFDHFHNKVFVEVLKDKSIDKKVVVPTVEEGGPCWMTPYLKYLQDGTLPADVTEVRRTKRHGTVQHLPKYDLISVLSAWPFCMWAIDIVGPFPRSVGNAKFLAVAIDFFSKWVEAKVLARITGENIKKFLWNDIVCRYGLPNEIVSDNGKQLADNPFKSWCEELSIKQTFTSVVHSQANGQVKVTNKEIVAGINARLGLSHTKWVDEIPYVLWAHRTTPKRSTGETPFSLVYGTKAVIPAEIRILTQRVLAFDVESNSSILRENLNLLEERRIMAAIRQAYAK
ncbi:uncharacterized protein [Rutidosis leptorrhynchoides]|uniref:uncharacterized protein n=1 Tax=Rutidosis leptorrhynchoides TaxID=125765 RepID=UPI003A9A2D97